MLDDRFSSSFKNQTEAFLSLVEELRDNPRKKCVHKMRVATRRLRVQLKLLQSTSSTADVAKTQRQLRKLGRVLGERRTLDVASEDAKSYDLKTKKIDQKRKKAGRRVKQSLKKSKIEALAKRLNQIGDQLREVKSEAYTGELSEWLPKIEQLRTETPRKNSDWHQVRIELKKLRYTLEAFGKRVPELEEIQDHLGRWHDLEVLQELIRRDRKIEKDAVKERNAAGKLRLKALRSTEESLLRILANLPEPTRPTSHALLQRLKLGNHPAKDLLAQRGAASMLKDSKVMPLPN